MKSVLHIINNARDTRYTSESIKFRAPSMFVRYFAGEPQNLLGGHGNYNVSQYVSLSKFLDGSRNLVASQFGQRDGILARLAETYLIPAEAYGRLGQYAQAIRYLNKVRNRAAYKAGENRSAYVDGDVAYKNNSVATAAVTSYSDKNTYFELNNIPVTSTETNPALHLNSENDIFSSNKEFYDKIGASSQSDKFLTSILNERSRELMGELMRWEDLARTKTLVDRTTVFSD